MGYKRKELDPGDLIELDLEIMRRLPQEGSRAGYHPLVATVAHLQKVLRDALPADERKHAPSSDQVSGRARMLALYGFTKAVRMGGNTGTGYQITPKGEQALARHGIHQNSLREVS